MSELLSKEYLDNLRDAAARGSTAPSGPQEIERMRNLLGHIDSLESAQPASAERVRSVVADAIMSDGDMVCDQALQAKARRRAERIADRVASQLAVPESHLVRVARVADSLGTDPEADAAAAASLKSRSDSRKLAEPVLSAEDRDALENIRVQLLNLIEHGTIREDRWSAELTLLDRLLASPQALSAPTLSTKDRALLQWLRDLATSGVEVLSHQPSDPVVRDHRAKYAAAVAMIDRLLGAKP